MSQLTDPVVWSILASMATVLGFVVVSYTAVVAMKQFREMTKSRHLEAMLKVYDKISSQEARNQRRFIYSRLKSPPEEITEEEREQVEQVSITMDNIGKLVKDGLVPAHELLDSHCEVFVRTWKKLHPYILHHRKIIGGRHVEHFEWLAVIAQQHYHKNISKEELKFF